mmetsp:Transcript_18074/g.44951  ORF Transcript_18074/g.44951 Transcript_18074/m.44951 type:complete len:306 (-) Transcript_18074:6907-7824(-)
MPQEQKSCLAAFRARSRHNFLAPDHACVGRIDLVVRKTHAETLLLPFIKEEDTCTMECLSAETLCEGFSYQKEVVGPQESESRCVLPPPGRENVVLLSLSFSFQSPSLLSASAPVSLHKALCDTSDRFFVIKRGTQVDDSFQSPCGVVVRFQQGEEYGREVFVVHVHPFHQVMHPMESHGEGFFPRICIYGLERHTFHDGLQHRFFLGESHQERQDVCGTLFPLEDVVLLSQFFPQMEVVPFHGAHDGKFRSNLCPLHNFLANVSWGPKSRGEVLEVLEGLVYDPLASHCLHQPPHHHLFGLSVR